MKKSLLLACAIFGLNIAIAQTTNNPQTPGVAPNMPTQTAPGSQATKTGTQNSDGTNNKSNSNKSGNSKSGTGKTNAAGNKGSDTQGLDGGTNPKSTSSTPPPSSGTPKNEE